MNYDANHDDDKDGRYDVVHDDDDDGDDDDDDYYYYHLHLTIWTVMVLMVRVNTSIVWHSPQSGPYGIARQKGHWLVMLLDSYCSWHSQDDVDRLRDDQCCFLVSTETKNILFSHQVILTNIFWIASFGWDFVSNFKGLCCKGNLYLFVNYIKKRHLHCSGSCGNGSPWSPACFWLAAGARQRPFHR